MNTLGDIARANIATMDTTAQLLFTHRIATACLADPFGAEDAAQNVLASLHRRGIQLHRIENPKGYLYQCVVHECRNHSQRSAKNQQSLGALLARYEASENRHPATPLMDAERKAAILLAVNRLSDKLRETVLMKIYGDMTLEEIARAVSAPLGTIQSRYQLALSELRVLLKGQHE